MEVERARAKKSYLARSRSKLYREPNISKAVYGKENTVKLTTTVKGLTTNLDGIWRSVYPMNQTLRASNDWANFEASYQNFNIVKVKVQIVSGSMDPTSTAFTNTHLMGICYSGKDSAALTNVNQLADYKNYSIWSPVNADTYTKHFFKVRIRPRVRPPLATSDQNEQFGWIKAYSTNIGNSLEKDCCYLVFVFTVAFSGES